MLALQVMWLPTDAGARAELWPYSIVVAALITGYEVCTTASTGICRPV